VQRRRETQAAILSAAIRLLIKEGHIGFSASRVAAMAGVSRGAQEHYFPTKIDLLAAATRHAMNEAVDHARSLAKRATRSTDPTAKFLADSEHFFFSPVYRAMIEIVLAARSDQALSRVCYPIVQEARLVLNGIWIDTLRTAGYPRKNAQQFIELTHYMLRGIFLVSTWPPYEVNRPALIKAWRRLAPKVLSSEVSGLKSRRSAHR
jgi:AcrR family transcriptional regulator